MAHTYDYMLRGTRHVEHEPEHEPDRRGPGVLPRQHDPERLHKVLQLGLPPEHLRGRWARYGA